MKRLLLSLTLATSMMATLSSFAGGETSGGGDAVYVEDQLVIRDFLEASSFKTILRNEEFLNGIPDLRNLILDISKVHPELALAVVKDLMRVTLYHSSVALPLLPASTTAFSGPKADVQLAIRTGNEIILHRDIQKIKDASYVMIHEALHSLLSENEGPMHHHRVRAIVKYLKENRGSYDKESLQIHLVKNKYYSEYRTSYSELEFFKLNDLDLKCYSIRGNTYVEKYFNLNCNGAGIENFLGTKVFSNLGEERRYRNYFYLLNYQSTRNLSAYDRVSKVELPETRFYHKKEISEQKYQCQKSADKMKNLEREMIEANAYLVLTQEYLKAMDSKELTTSEKAVIKEYLMRHEDYDVEIVKDRFLAYIDDLNKQFAIGRDNAARCLAKFPNEN